MTVAPQLRNRGELQVYADAEQLAGAGAELFVMLAGKSIEQRGRFRVSLSGGSTPRRVYQLLATDEYSSRIPWDRVDLFWGDERYVPADDHDSNYRMTAEALLQHVPVPAANVHRVRTEISPPAEAASAYEGEIRQVFQCPSSVPHFDLVFLGLGTNGHTASLFPHSPLLSDQSKLVAAEFVSEVNQWRITVTVPLINRGRTVAFLVEGQPKAEVVREVLVGTPDPRRLPAQLIAPDAKLLWMMDETAASLLHGAEKKRNA